MEYSMIKIPTVASRVYPYFIELDGKDTIRDGETGFLCSTPEQWEKTLSKLIEDEELRIKIGQQAYNYIKDNWQYKDSKIEEKLDSLLQEIE